MNHNHQLTLKAEKKVKEIKGFYTHCFATFLILPFLVFINLQTVPQFHWFWIAFLAWVLGLLIHWIIVFGFSKMTLKQEWEAQKINQYLKESNYDQEFDQSNGFLKEQYYLKAKKKATEIKGFYMHLLVNVSSFAIILFINLQFVPGFHFFWFAFGGMSIALFFHWLGVFGFEFLGLGKKWEERKINEIIKKYQ